MWWGKSLFDGEPDGIGRKGEGAMLAKGGSDGVYQGMRSVHTRGDEPLTHFGGFVCKDGL